MKKGTVQAITIAFFSCVIFAACKKNKVPFFANETIVTDSILYKGVLGGGEFGDFATGAVSVEKLSGKKYLVFKNFASSNGPAVHVYLSKTIGSNAMPATEFIDIGLLKATAGAFNYELTTNPDITNYKYALVWCAQFNIQFGVAELKK
ncbi:MAG: DM13 domain-containing protein [Bacteroidota bacterium]